jgi:hypothetical protein
MQVTRRLYVICGCTCDTAAPSVVSDPCAGCGCCQQLPSVGTAGSLLPMHLSCLAFIVPRCSQAQDSSGGSGTAG